MPVLLHHGEIGLHLIQHRALHAFYRIYNPIQYGFPRLQNQELYRYHEVSLLVWQAVGSILVPLPSFQQDAQPQHYAATHFDHKRNDISNVRSNEWFHDRFYRFQAWIPYLHRFSWYWLPFHFWSCLPLLQYDPAECARL